MNEISNKWSFNLQEVTQSKRVGRPGLRPGGEVDIPAFELIGVDGANETGVRPFPGFSRVHVLGNAGLDVLTNHNSSSEVVDFFPIKFRVGSDGYAYGFVYRLERGATPGTADIYIDYWDSVSGAWTYHSLVMEACEADQQMAVEMMGRFLFVFVKGRDPVLFYLQEKEASPGEYEEVAVGTDPLGPFPGPGKPPTLISPENQPTNLGDITSTGGDDVPAAGCVFLTEFLPTEFTLGLGGEILTNTDEWGSTTQTTTSTATGIGTTSTQTSTTTDVRPTDCYVQQDGDVRKLEAGDYVFAYVLHDSKTGRKSALSEIAQARYEDFIPAYLDQVLYPTEGQSSALYVAMEICYDSSKYDQAFIYRSVKTQDAGGTFIAGRLFLEKIIDLECHWTKKSRDGTLAADIKNAVYFMELEDKQLVFQDGFLERPAFDEGMPRGGCAKAYLNTLFISNIENNETSIVPPGTPNSYYVAGIGWVNRTLDATRNIGEIRWSALTEISPELFPPFNRFTPNQPTAEVIAFQEVAGNLIGFSKDRQYMIRKDSAYVRVIEMHEGFGIVGPYACETVGSMVYFVSPRGMMVIDSNGQLDFVRSLNFKLKEEWSVGSSAVGGSDIHMALDPTMSALFVLNSTVEEMMVFWFSTGKLTELRDCRFKQVRKGMWPGDLMDPAHSGEYSSDLQERAFFLGKDQVNIDGTGSSPDWGYALYVTDFFRDRNDEVSPTAGVRISMVGNGYGAVPAQFTSTGATTVAGNKVTIPVGEAVGFGTSWQNGYLYVVSVSDSANSSWVGKKALIYDVDTGAQSVKVYDETEGVGTSDLHGLPVGSRVVMSPIYFRWVGYPIGLSTEEGVVYSNKDFFTVKHADVIGCSFVDVSGQSEGTPFARFTGLMYRGSEVTPSGKGVPRDLSGGEVVSVSENEGLYWAALGTGGVAFDGETRFGIEGTVLTPGVEILVSDLDFRLMAVQVTGTIQDTQRSGMPS